MIRKLFSVIIVSVVSANCFAAGSDGTVLQTILEKCGLDGAIAGDAAIMENGSVVSLNLANRDLSKDGYAELPAEIGQLTELRELDCSGNILQTIPPELGNCTKLKKLDLKSNRITVLPPEIGRLVNLTYLDLKHNSLSVIPPELGNCGNLEYLWLWGNKLTALDPAIVKLRKLKELYLTDNRLTTLPLGIVGMRFKYIDLVGNKLCNMSSVLDIWAKKYDQQYRSLQRCL
jgi:Leucine-rich repeat (LRR) protein